MPRLDCANHILCVGYAVRLACVGQLSCNTRINHAARLASIGLAYCRCSMCQHGPCMVPARTIFEKLWRSGHLMVSLWSVGHMNTFGTIPAAVGPHRCPRSTEATSLYACVEVHVSTAVFAVRRVNCGNRILCVSHSDRLTVPHLMSRLCRLYRTHQQLQKCRRWSRTTFEKFHQIGYLMVPS